MSHERIFFIRKQATSYQLPATRYLLSANTKPGLFFLQVKERAGLTPGFTRFGCSLD